MVQRADLATLLVHDLQRLPFYADGWSRFANRLGEAFHGPVILATSRFPAGAPIATEHVMVGDAAMNQYRSHFYLHSPWRDWTAKAAQGDVAAGAQINTLPQKHYEVSSFYADFLRPNGMHHGMCARVSRDEMEATDLAVLRPPARGPITPVEIELVRGLVPHVRRALRVRSLLGAADMIGAGLLRQDVGVLLVDRQGHILFANPAAHLRLAESDGLATGRGGQVCATSAGAQKRLRTLVRFAVDGTGAYGLRGGGEMLLPRPPRPPLRVTIVATPQDGEMQGQLAPAALLLLREPPPPAPPPPVFGKFLRGDVS